MVSALQRARAATPGTQGKPDRGLATLSGSTCTRYQHGCNRILKHANKRHDERVGGGGGGSPWSFSGEDFGGVLLLLLL